MNVTPSKVNYGVIDSDNPKVYVQGKHAWIHPVVLRDDIPNMLHLLVLRT